MRSNYTEYEVVSDGVTVWVNRAVCIGRFGRFGIDIHREADALTKGECLFCTHSKTTKSDWLLFVEKMRELHGADVAQKHMPERFARHA